MFKIGSIVKFKQRYICNNCPDFNGTGVIERIIPDCRFVVKWHNGREWWLDKYYWELIPQDNKQLEFDFMKD